MKPGFALNLSHDGIGLLRRSGQGWVLIGEVSLEDPDLGGRLAALRDAAAALPASRLVTKLIIPNSQILYTEVEAPGPATASRRAAIAKALEGRTPYPVADLVFDWSGTGRVVQVAVVARETLAEAEAFAEEHGFAPVSFVTIPEDGAFGGEPYFGPASRAAEHLTPGERLDRDQDPVRIVGRDALSVAPVVEAEPEAVVEAKPETMEPATAEAASPVEEPAEPQGEPEAPDAGAAAADPAPSPVPPEEQAATEPADTGKAEVLAADDATTIAETREDEDKGGDLTAPAETAETEAGAGELEPAPQPASEPVEASAPGAEDTAAIADSAGAADAEDRPVEVWRSRFQVMVEGAELREPLPEIKEYQDQHVEKPAAAPDAAEVSAPYVLTFSSRRVGVPEPPAPDTESGKPGAPVVGAAKPPSPGKGAAPKLGSAAPPRAPRGKGAGAALGKPARPETAAVGDSAGSVAVETSEASEASKSEGAAAKPAFAGIARTASRISGAPASRHLQAWIDRAGRKVRSGVAQAGMPAKARKAQPAPAPAKARPELTVFGARRMPTKPSTSAYLGLTLALALLLFIGAVALWSSLLGSGDTTPDIATGSPAVVSPGTTADLAAAPETPAQPVEESVPEIATPAAPVDQAADADPPVPAEVAAAPEVPAAAVSDTLQAPSGPEPGDAGATTADLTEPDIWTRTPDAESPPAPDALNAMTPRLPDREPAARSAVALPDSGGIALYRQPAPLPAPLPFGTEIVVGADGMAVPTPEGTVMPEGFSLYSGKPARVPPARPAAIAAAAAAPEAASEPDPLEGKRPRARPAGIAPEPPPTGADATDGAAAEQPAEMPGDDPPPVADPALAGKTPTARPAAVLAAAEAEAAEEPQEASALAVASSRRPSARPRAFSRAVDAAVAAAVAEPEPAPEATAAAAPAPGQDIDEPEPEAAAPDIPTRASVAKQATVTNAIKLNQINLIGVYGSSSNRRALIRLGNGKFVKVQVGDRLDGGKVAAISDRQLSYIKGGRTIVLEMPRDG